MDKEQAKSWIEKIEAISGINTNLAKELEIDTLPQTLEELQSLDEETKKKLFGTLGKDISDLDDIIQSYTIEEKNEETGEITKKLGENFSKEVKLWEKEAKED